MSSKQLTPDQTQELLSTLKVRFEKNIQRHKGILWEKVQKKLETEPEKLWSLSERNVPAVSLM